MKHFIFIASLFVFGSVHAQWTQLNSNTVSNLNQVVFTNDSTGYIVGSGGMLKTTDNGSAWDTSMTNTPIDGISFPTESTGYAVGGYPGMIFKTVDQGINWTQDSVPGGYVSGTVHFTNDSTGYIIGDTGFMLKTTNQGNSWSSAFVELSILMSIYFTDDSIGYMAGWYIPYLGKTTDAGNTWQTISGSYALYSIYFPSADTGYAVGWYGTIIKTTDAGNNWSVQTSGLSSTTTIYSIHCPDNDTCYAVGADGTIVKTADGGNTWTTQVSGKTTQLNSIYCTDVSTCYAVGDSGLILKTFNGGVGIDKKSQKKNEVNVYPNPFTTSTTIQSDHQISSYRIYSINAQLVRQETDLSSNTITIERGDLPSGMYFIEVHSKEGVLASEKVIIQ